MTISIKQRYKICRFAWLCIFPLTSFAQTLPQTTILPPGPDMDLTVKYFNREKTPDGVLHESSYAEKMIRRKGHVWSQRILPSSANSEPLAANHEHKDFNYILLPRHVSYDGNNLAVEFIDSHERQVIHIAPAEYENINFDGSWANTYFLVNPETVANMPIIFRTTAVTHAQWHELSKNGMFQRVLWDKKRSIPLIIETGDQAGNFLQRVEIRPNVQRVNILPWNKLQGYAQKEYSDFLD